MSVNMMTASRRRSRASNGVPEGRLEDESSFTRRTDSAMPDLGHARNFRLRTPREHSA
jgi:hypothetical protein